MVHTFTVRGDHFAFDSVTGALHQLDDAALLVVERTKKNGGKVTDEDLLTPVGEAVASLISEGELFSAERTFSTAELYPDAPRIKAMCLNLCHDCNLRCTYCFAGTGDYGGPRGLMSVEVGKKAIDFLIEESGKRRNLDIDFFGGEPLINWETVKALVSYCKQRESETGKKLRLTLTTNATLIDAEKAAFINEHFVNVVLSIDGRQKIHDAVRPGVGGKSSYQKTVQGIRTLLDSRGDLAHHLRGTFTNLNLDFSKDIMHLAELSPHVSIEPVVLPDEHPLALQETDVEEILAEYERLAVILDQREAAGEPVDFFHFRMDLNEGPCQFKRHKGCGVGTEYVAVTPDGDIYPCHQLVGEDVFRMGSVFSGIDNADVKDRFSEILTTPPDACHTCFARPICGGGCAANRWHRSGDVRGDDDLGCRLLRRRAELSLWLLARRLEREASVLPEAAAI